MSITISSNIHVGDAGTSLVFVISDSGVIVNLSTATLLQIFLRKPDGTVLTRSASLLTDGSDGKIEYVSVDEDFSVSGIYQIQGYMEFGESNWSTEIVKFRVYPNIQ